MSSVKKSDNNIILDKKHYSEVNEIKFLRLLIDQNLSLKSHINLLTSLSSFPLRILS